MNLGAFDLNLLKVLHALLTERHVTRAAERLGRSQPAVSNALQRLRQSLGDDLLVRSPNGLALTPRAQLLQQPLRDLLALVDDTVLGPSPFDPATTDGVFRVALPDRLTIAIVPPLFERLHRAAPRLALQIVTADRDHAVELLNADAIDAFVGWVDDPPQHLHSEFLLDEAPFCVMRRGHPLTRRKRFTIAALLSYPHLAVSAAGGRTQIFDDRLAQHGLARHAQVILTSFTAVPHILRGSDMVGVFTRFAAEAFLPGDGLIKRPLPLDVGNITTSLIWHARYERDPRHAWLRAQITSVCKTISGMTIGRTAARRATARSRD